MKTLNEVELHILTNGYKLSEIDKICGYLIGAGMKDSDTELFFAIGDGTFDEFYVWFNGIQESEDSSADTCTSEECVLCSIMRDIAENLQDADTQEEKNYYFEQLAFLVDAFDLDEEDSE